MRTMSPTRRVWSASCVTFTTCSFRRRTTIRWPGACSSFLSARSRTSSIFMIFPTRASWITTVLGAAQAETPAATTSASRAVRFMRSLLWRADEEVDASGPVAGRGPRPTDVERPECGGRAEVEPVRVDVPAQAGLRGGVLDVGPLVAQSREHRQADHGDGLQEPVLR